TSGTMATSAPRRDATPEGGTASGHCLATAARPAAGAIVPRDADAPGLGLAPAADDARSAPDGVTVSLGGLSTAAGPRTCQLDTGNGADRVTVQSLATDATLTVLAGAGNDAITVGFSGPFNTGTVDAIRGTLVVQGQTGINTL